MRTIDSLMFETAEQRKSIRNDDSVYKFRRSIYTAADTHCTHSSQICVSRQIYSDSRFRCCFVLHISLYRWYIVGRSTAQTLDEAWKLMKNETANSHKQLRIHYYRPYVYHNAKKKWNEIRAKSLWHWFFRMIHRERPFKSSHRFDRQAIIMRYLQIEISKYVYMWFTW